MGSYSPLEHYSTALETEICGELCPNCVLAVPAVPGCAAEERRVGRQPACAPVRRACPTRAEERLARR